LFTAGVGRLCEVTDAMGNLATYIHDPAGDLTAVTDANR